MADLQAKSTDLATSTNPFMTDKESTLKVDNWLMGDVVNKVLCKKITGKTSGWRLGDEKYLMCCTVKNTHASMSILVDIYIGMNEGNGTITQTLETVTLMAGETKVLEIPIVKNAPLRVYDGIYFKISPQTSGTITATDDILELKLKHFYAIRGIANLAQVKRLGVQGPPHMWIMLNDQGIRIGRSGTFELLTENVNIDFVGFMPMNNEFFLVDYTK